MRVVLLGRSSASIKSPERLMKMVRYERPTDRCDVQCTSLDCLVEGNLKEQVRLVEKACSAHHVTHEENATPIPISLIRKTQQLIHLRGSISLQCASASGLSLNCN